jgi:putative ABC transport system permease protein
VNEALTYLSQTGVTISHGVFYGIAAIGLSIVVRYLQCPDFTTLGSMLMGGIVGIYVFTGIHINCIMASFVALSAGTVSGIVLGLITGFLNIKIRIPFAYAGILTYVASISVAYLLAPNGALDIDRNQATIFKQIPDPWDLLVGLMIALAVAGLCHRGFKRKHGKLIIAMKSSPVYLKLRHPTPNKTTVIILIICNALVGLSGALFALRDSNISVKGGNEMTFLLVGLGSIYAFEFVSSLLRWMSDAALEFPDNPVSVLNKPVLNHLVRAVSSRFSSKQGDSKSFFVVACGYVCLCVLLELLLDKVSNSDKVPVHFEYFATVAVIVLTLGFGTRFLPKV